jgi:hypothetical protein
MIPPGSLYGGGWFHRPTLSGFRKFSPTQGLPQGGRRDERSELVTGPSVTYDATILYFMVWRDFR